MRHFEQKIIQSNNERTNFMSNCPTGVLQGCQFTQLLVNQQPFYDKYIIEDIRPVDGWLAHVTSGTWDAWSGTQHTRDRFNNVYPNVTKAWEVVGDGSCAGAPCDPKEHLIGWGSTRLTYFQERQAWSTPLICYDQELTVTKAKEQWSYIISKILKPAVTFVQGNFIRKRGAQYADNKYIANRNFGSAAANFVYTWVLGGPNGDEEIYIDTNCPPTSVFKLTPQMLQRLVEPLLRIGYLGENPFADKTPPMLQLVTDTQTCWELDRLGGQQGFGTGNTPTTFGNWRFTDWDAANKYWAYGFSGQIGNFAVRVDPESLRFNYVGVVAGKYRYQVVQPYKNIPSSGAGSAAGQKSISNPDYDAAQYRWSYVWHAKGIELLVAETPALNSEMPFLRRSMAGNWMFAMNNLGADRDGVAISNKWGNKGQWLCQFKQGVAPNYTEFLVLIFHKGEPSCVAEITTCNSDPGYPTQNYESNTGLLCTNTAAPYVLTNTPTTQTSTGTYELEANTILCNGVMVEHGQITGTSTLANLVAQLNALVGVLGTWAASGSNITLTGTCSTVQLPWLT